MNAADWLHLVAAIAAVLILFVIWHGHKPKGPHG